MDFAEKKAAYGKLLGAEYLEADLKLLRSKNPEASALNTGLVNKGQAQSDILWDLLDVATPEEVAKNRGTDKKKKETPAEKEKRLLAAAAERARKIEGEKQKVEEELKAATSADIEKMAQKEYAKIARLFEIEAPDFKGDTLRPLILKLREKLLNEKGTGNLGESGKAPGENTKKNDAATDGAKKKVDADESQSPVDSEKKNT